MAAFLGERPIKQIVIDCDYTIYPKTAELDVKVWGSVEEAQIKFLMQVRGLQEADYEEFSALFHKLGESKGYFAAFLELGGSKEDFSSFIKNIDISQYLAYDQTLAAVLSLLNSQVELFIYSGSPADSVEKVIAAVIHQQRANIFQGIIGKEVLDANGLQKTDQAAFQLMIDSFNIKQDEMIMVDDSDRSLDIASSLGLSVVKVDPEKSVQKLPRKVIIPRLSRIMQILNFR